MERGKITISDGAGGLKMEKFLKKHIIGKLYICKNEKCIVGIEEMDDAGILNINEKDLAFTSDSFTVNPIFFPGGSIGKLSVCGTVNDLAVMGAEPLAMSISFLIPTGFEIDKLEKVVYDIREVAKKVNITIACGDTKVVENLDNLIISASGIGICENVVKDSSAKPGDKILVNGFVGNHGFAVLLAQKKFEFQGKIQSDVAPVWNIIKAVAEGIGWKNIHAMKDPTRGGISEALNEMAIKSNCIFEIEEEKIPLEKVVCVLSNILGISPYEMSNEGKVLMIVDKKYGDEALKIMKEFDKNASIIGSVKKRNVDKGKVLLKTKEGGIRYLRRPLGDPVPRVC